MQNLTILIWNMLMSNDIDYSKGGECANLRWHSLRDGIENV